MKKTVAIFTGSPGTSPVYGLRSLARAFENLGYKAVTLNPEDRAVRENMGDIVTQENVLCFLTHNMRGCDFQMMADNQEQPCDDLLNTSFVSIIDTPLNKVEMIREAISKKILLLSDKTFLSLVEKLALPDTVTAHFPAYVVDGYDPADQSSIKPISDRTIDILWVGRVGANTAAISRSGNMIRRALSHRVLKEALYSQNRQIHDIFMDIRKRNWFLRNIPPFRDPCSAESLYFLWGLSNIVRTRRRMRVLEELASLSTNIRLVVVSNNPEGLSKMFKSNVELLPFQKWPRVVELMRDAKVVINVQPFHVYGSHERLVTAMAHGAAVATDRNPYLEERFEDGQDLIFYEFTKGHLRKKLLEYLGNLERLRCMVQKGTKKVLKQDLAIHRAQDIIALVKRVSSGEVGRRQTESNNIVGKTRRAGCWSHVV